MFEVKLKEMSWILMNLFDITKHTNESITSRELELFILKIVSI